MRFLGRLYILYLIVLFIVLLSIWATTLPSNELIPTIGLSRPMFLAICSTQTVALALLPALVMETGWLIAIATFTATNVVTSIPTSLFSPLSFAIPLLILSAKWLIDGFKPATRKINWKLLVIYSKTIIIAAIASGFLAENLFSEKTITNTWDGTTPDFLLIIYAILATIAFIVILVQIIKHIKGALYFICFTSIFFAQAIALSHFFEPSNPNPAYLFIIFIALLISTSFIMITIDNLINKAIRRNP